VLLICAVPPVLAMTERWSCACCAEAVALTARKQLIGRNFFIP
jgi:hypothetical protein